MTTQYSRDLSGREITAFIPARKGSKRLPMKNVRMFHGKPLTAWTIEYAVNSGVFDRILLSTDDEEVMALAGNGVEVCRRPSAFAGDDITLMEVIWELCKEKDLHPKSIFVLLMPTGPLRVPSDLTECLEFFARHQCARTVFTVNVNPHAPGIVWLDKDDGLAPYVEKRTQKDTQKHRHKPTYYFNDLILLDAVENFLAVDRDLFGHNPLGVMTPDERGMPIDYEIQMRLAETLFPPTDERAKESTS